jgi:hypothetical protein
MYEMMRMPANILKHQFCIKTDLGDQCSKLDSLPRSIAIAGPIFKDGGISTD